MHGNALLAILTRWHVFGRKSNTWYMIQTWGKGLTRWPGVQSPGNPIWREGPYSIKGQCSIKPGFNYQPINGSIHKVWTNHKNVAKLSFNFNLEAEVEVALKGPYHLTYLVHEPQKSHQTPKLQENKNWLGKKAFIKVSVTPNREESGKISQPTKSLFPSVIIQSINREW